MIADALRLSVYFGDAVAADGVLSSDALMGCFERHRPAAAMLLRGVEGFGAHRRIRAARFPDLSTDLPLLAIAVDEHDRIRGMIDAVDEAVPRGLLTLEHALLATGADVASAKAPDGPGRAAKLSVYCRADERIDGRPADRQVVEILRRHGATGAVALPGADGVLRGERARLRVLSVRDRPIVAIVSVGPRELLARCLPSLAEALQDPLVTLEAIAQVKHDGQLLEPPPSVTAGAGGEPDLWQTIRVYTRRSAQVDGRALYSELTHRLREAGAAGATTVFGDWGFSSDEPAHGDRLGRIGSQRPSYTVYIDRPERVAEIWPVVDEVTAEHGIVTSLLVPGYRERVGEDTHGSLDVAERAAWVATLAGREPTGRSVAGAGQAAGHWTAELVRRAKGFASRRGGHAPIVRVTLDSGERFFLFDLEPGPGEALVTLYPHPKHHGEMLRATDGAPLTPRAVVVRPDAIAEVEFLHRAPRGTRSLVTLMPHR
ncbi:MAG: DUF190 domain-containing protein [Solirubrobacterales bacterium]